MVKLEQTENKSFAQPKAKTTKTKQPSKTNVNPKRGHGVGCWNGRRKLVGIRVDENLYKAFKPVAKRVFGSVCRPIEAYMVSVLTLQQKGVNFGNTIRIEKQIIERNLRPRRKLEYTSEVDHVDCCGLCGRGFEDVFHKVEYISHAFACLCPDCFRIQRDRSVVKDVIGKMSVERRQKGVG
ncbi:MAG: hypothetical protein OEZ25_05815 [Candidatus Bathyarchaeota archaeon]|nr:hypothetical protein [Candidatus Bathyarchaeota archaeon]